jgi:hypothetical protein
MNQTSTRKYETRLEAFQDNTGEAHPLAELLPAEPARRKRAGSVALKNNAQVLWTGTVSLGTPARQFTADFDTGSADTIVPATGCGAACAGLMVYSPKNSSTAVDLKKNFSLGYGDGTMTSGKQYTDTVQFAGFKVRYARLGPRDVAEL